MFVGKKLNLISLCILMLSSFSVVICTTALLTSSPEAAAEPGSRSLTDRALMFNPFTLTTISPTVSDTKDSEIVAENVTDTRDMLLLNESKGGDSLLNTLKGPNPRIPQRPEWRSPVRPGW